MLFLHVKEGGPTAAAAVWKHLEYLRAKLGAPLQTKAGWVPAFADVQAGHEASQAFVLPPWAGINILLAAQTATGTRKTWL